MAADKTNWNLTGGQLLQLLAWSMVYPVFQAFRAGLTLYGVLLLAVVVPSFVVGRRLYKRGQAQEPGNIIRTHDHREKRPPDTGAAQPGNSD